MLQIINLSKSCLVSSTRLYYLRILLTFHFQSASTNPMDISLSHTVHKSKSNIAIVTMYTKRAALAALLNLKICYFFTLNAFLISLRTTLPHSSCGKSQRLENTSGVRVSSLILRTLYTPVKRL